MTPATVPLGAASEVAVPVRSLAADRGRALALRAEAWLRQRLSEPPSIAALCAAVGASERTLYEAFREHLHATPKAYLKTLRLEAARRDLLLGPGRRRVTDVALDWGFLHFGWFSQEFHRRGRPRSFQVRDRPPSVRVPRRLPPDFELRG
jgi:AraC family ethanolamine operon transcriptional activator